VWYRIRVESSDRDETDRRAITNIRENLDKVLATLPEAKLREVLGYAEFLSEREERDAWRQFGQSQFASAYGPNEPEYSPADFKKEVPS